MKLALMKEHQDDLGRLITLENGKTQRSVVAEVFGEHAYSASFIEWFAEEAVRTYGEHIPSPFANVRNVTIKQPIGVVSILTPWNFPSAMIIRKLGAALAAGCTSVIKPPPETAVLLARRAGVPDGVINVVTTHKNVSFTGSTAVAKLLAGMSALTLKKVSIEAGGNAPFIVFDDADIDEAVAAATICKFRGTGQTCVCANRIYVQSSVYAEFASRLAEKESAFKVGNGLDESTYAPAYPQQLPTNRLTHHQYPRPAHSLRARSRRCRRTSTTRSRSARRCSSVARAVPGTSFFNPTVLSDVPLTARINNEETFGPLAALIKFETEDEVIKLANSTDVGLAGYFFSRDVGRVWRVAEKLEVGMVGCNTGLISQAVIPFGGIKESGLGREGGHGIDEYMNTRPRPKVRLVQDDERRKRDLSSAFLQYMQGSGPFKPWQENKVQFQAQHPDEPHLVWESFKDMEGVTELARFAILLLGLVINQASTERTFSDLKVKKTRLRNCLGIEKLGKMSKVGANIRQENLAAGLIHARAARDYADALDPDCDTVLGTNKRRPYSRCQYGPMLVGVFFNMILYGVFIGQVLTYYQLYCKDDAWMRYFVAYLFVLETVNTGLDIGIMYQPLILEYGRTPVHFPLLFPSRTFP
ncbi:Aldehyde/histidinol dehydrogenase [Mycena metata]|uniref:Aldehyde/histidinol dehydrogenase n=1 Tax=Mycena metata TaxID=1033252 RepID=A0AAD7K1M3_9AGAR|nr:Aldehyde/histidinol dehydrogenase [Mycena metata]